MIRLIRGLVIFCLRQKRSLHDRLSWDTDFDPSVDRVMVVCAETLITENTLTLNLGGLGNSSTKNGGDDAMMLDAAICLPHAARDLDSSTASGELVAAASNNRYCLQLNSTGLYRKRK